MSAHRQGREGPLIPGRTSGHAIIAWICSRQASVIFLVLVLFAVLALSLTPHPESVLGRFNLYDKAGHFAAYVVLSFLAVRVFYRGRLLPLVLAIAACAFLGGAIELVQPFVGRHRELLDFLIDLGGSAIGAAVSFLVLRRGETRESS